MKLDKIDKVFKDDPIAKEVAYMIATSHEYKEPNEDSAIKLVGNYKWERKDMKISNLQGIDKPVIKEKVFSLAKSINPKNLKPLMVVDKFQGITPQSKGKKILLDGHHRKEACEFKDINIVPTFYGRYTGNTEKSIEEIMEKNAGINPMTAFGAGAMALGAGKIHSEFKKGNLTGRETVYHNTNKKNVSKIKEKGLLAERASDEDNITHVGLSDILKEEDMKGLVYVGRKKAPALGVGLTSAIHDAKQKDSKNHNNLVGAIADRRTVKANIPSWKMNIVDNPELQGAKSKKEFRPHIEHRIQRSGPSQGSIAATLYKPVSKLGSRVSSGIMHDSLGRKGTHTIKGDVESKYIKGSKDYRGISKEEVKDYIAKNPDRFKNGLLDAGIGAGALSAGALMMAKGLKKVASEDSIEKEARINTKILRAALGAGLVAGSTNAILGKKKLYHGTSKDNWDNIKREGMKADKGGSGASQSVGNSAYQKNSEGKVHLTGLKSVANMYSASNTEEIKKKKDELRNFKDRVFNVEVHQGAPGKSTVDYKLKKGRQKIYQELAGYKEDELKRLNIKQRSVKNILGDPSKRTDGKTVKVNLDYDKWKAMEQDREGVAFKRQVNGKLKGDNNPIVKHMAARGNIDVSPEEISGSDAKLSAKAKHTMEKLPGYIKNNPGRFGAGVASAGTGAALIASALRGGK